jgi:hypothetical protein
MTSYCHPQAEDIAIQERTLLVLISQDKVADRRANQSSKDNGCPPPQVRAVGRRKEQKESGCYAA